MRKQRDDLEGCCIGKSERAKLKSDTIQCHAEANAMERAEQEEGRGSIEEPSATESGKQRKVSRSVHFSKVRKLHGKDSRLNRIYPSLAGLVAGAGWDLTGTWHSAKERAWASVSQFVGVMTADSEAIPRTNRSESEQRHQSPAARPAQAGSGEG